MLEKRRRKIRKKDREKEEQGNREAEIQKDRKTERHEIKSQKDKATKKGFNKTYRLLSRCESSLRPCLGGRAPFGPRRPP